MVAAESELESISAAPHSSQGREKTGTELDPASEKPCLAYDVKDEVSRSAGGTAGRSRQIAHCKRPTIFHKVDAPTLAEARRIYALRSDR